MSVTRLVDIAGFALYGALVLALVLEAHLDDRTAPLGELLEQVMSGRPARIAIVLFWWWTGWHFLVSQEV